MKIFFSECRFKPVLWPGARSACRSSFFILLSCSFLISSCKKEDNPVTLPPITSHGANTFGAIVNGETISISGSANFSGGLYADPQEDSCQNCWLPPDSSDLYIRIKKEGKNAIYLFLTDPRVCSEWQLNKPTPGFWELDSRKVKAYVEIEGFRTGLTTDGWIRSDFYSRNDGIFSAQFDFHCINPKTCQEFRLSSGRVDVNLKSIPHFP